MICLRHSYCFVLFLILCSYLPNYNSVSTFVAEQSLKLVYHNFFHKKAGAYGSFHSTLPLLSPCHDLIIVAKVMRDNYSVSVQVYMTSKALIVFQTQVKVLVLPEPVLVAFYCISSANSSI